jgi:6-pyruvoyl-tetrahydropterin synthase
MYSVKIRQHIMIAHSLKSDVFGPAQQLHGATYVVDAAFQSKKLDKNNIVLDIGMAMDLLKKVLKPLEYQNLDKMPVFKGKLTTTEFLAAYIHQEIAKALKGKFKGKLTVTLGESHIAWASYTAKIK